VFEAGQRESRLMQILVALNNLRADETFRRLLKGEDLTEEPELKGQYTV